MRRIDLLGDEVEWRGVAWLESGTDGVSPRRVAGHHLGRLDEQAALRVNAATGVRLVGRTDADTIELHCQLRSLTPGVAPDRPVADLVVAGTIVDSRGPNDHVAGAPSDEPEVFRLHRPGAGEEEIAIWLPHDAVVTVAAVRIPDGASWSAPSVDHRPRWVHHGSSISHGGQAWSPARTWPAVAAHGAGFRLHNLGFPGECQVDQFAARTIRDLAADVVSLELGVNVVNGATMTARTFTSAVDGFLDTVRDGHPTAPVLVVSPIAFPAAEHHPGPTVVSGGRLVALGDPATVAAGALSIARVRELLAGIVATRMGEGDDQLLLVPGPDLLGPDDTAHLGDGLHPDGDGHLLLGRRFAPELAAALPPVLRAATPTG